MTPITSPLLSHSVLFAAAFYAALTSVLVSYVGGCFYRLNYIFFDGEYPDLSLTTQNPTGSPPWTSLHHNFHSRHNRLHHLPTKGHINPRHPLLNAGSIAMHNASLC